MSRKMIKTKYNKLKYIENEEPATGLQHLVVITTKHFIIYF